TQLLVDGHHLFVDDLRLLAGAVQLVDRAPQVLPCDPELPLQLPEDRRLPSPGRAAGRRRLALVGERDEQQALYLAAVAEGLRRYPHPLPPVAAPHAGAFHLDASPAVDGTAYGRPQLHLQALA